jgi:uncharacterized protein (DUF1501 family)
MLSRRGFLGLGAAAAGTAAAGGLLWTTSFEEQVRQAATATTPADRRRVVVVVQLGGGNDALNTLVPADGRYRNARPTLAIPEGELVEVPGHAEVALHPSLAPLVGRWVDGQVAALLSTGFLDQTRSHFTAMDTWWAAGGDPATGWLGRWLDASQAEGAAPDPLRAVALGAGAPALVGERSLSTAVRDPRTFGLALQGAVDPDVVVAAFRATAEPVASERVLAAAQAAVPATLEAVDVLAAAVASGAPSGDAESLGVPGHARSYGSQLTDLLDVAAGLIELDLGTQVIVVGVDGFDTHSGQLPRHAELLADLADGLTSFLDRVAEQGRGDDVLVLTTSEFGRRVAENASGGTDHGSGGTQLLLGPMVQGQVVGELDLGDLQDGDVRSTIDARSSYAVALDWLGGADPAEVLAEDPDRYGLLA